MGLAINSRELIYANPKIGVFKLKKDMAEVPSIICQHCGSENSLSDALHAQVMEQVQASAKEKVRHEYELKFASEKAELEQNARAEAQKLSTEHVTEMAAELKTLATEKTNLQIKLAKIEANNTSIKETMDAQIQLATASALERAKANYELNNQKQIEEINQLKRSIEALKSTSTNTSGQLTGEAGELLIEHRLRKLFPRDIIEEIQKGVNGADCLWSIRNNSGGVINRIYFESKVTQTFQSSWIPKLKNDMVNKNSAIGIIVTKTMPSDQVACGLRDGIWVCSFHEFEALAVALRQAQIELSRALLQQTSREDKSNELFDFVVGHEFSSIMEKVLRPIFEQQQLLEKEKRSLTRIWKAREKHIQSSIDGASLLAGQLEAILGASVVNKIGFENFELLEVLEDAEHD